MERMPAPVRVRKSILIDAPPERVHAFWSDLEHFPSFIPALKSVQVFDGVHSRWAIRAPLGHEVCFDATITVNEPPRRIVWESRHPAGEACGEIHLTGCGGRTRVDLDFRYTLYAQWIQELARLVNRMGFPERAFDIGLARIKGRIEQDPAAA